MLRTTIYMCVCCLVVKDLPCHTGCCSRLRINGTLGPDAAYPKVLIDSFTEYQYIDVYMILMLIWGMV